MKPPFRDPKRRLSVVAGIFLTALALAGLRAVYLQLWLGEALKRRGEKQHLKEWILLPKRGSIFDRSGEPLAVSVEAKSVYARPRRLQQPETVARAISQPLGIPAHRLQQLLRSEKPFVWIKRQITPREARQIETLNLDGIGLSYEPTRYYPQGALAGQVVGFVGTDSQGLEGIELQYDHYIRGESGTPVTERDALGRRVLVQGLEEIQTRPGADIHLTLDTAIQHLAEKELEAAAKKFRAKAGVAVVMDPFTGEILALANYPFFDPNTFAAEAADQRRNRAVTDSYEPGSTFKTILAAAALEEGVVGKDDLFYCELGRYSFAGRSIHDTHRYGWLPFEKIIQFSSNIGVTKVAEKLRKDRYYKYIERFGFGQQTGVDLPGEVTGMVRPAPRWAEIDLATHAFGQGIAVTPLQLATAYAAIANGGFLMRPFAVRRVVGAGGEVLLENQPHVVRRVVSEKTARLLTSILKGVVSEGGTGAKASVEGFAVAGKTGTAQKVDPVHRGYSPHKRVASFVGFAPADQPRLVALVVIDEPETNVYGGVVAAPAFQNIMRGALRHLGVVPEKTGGLPPPEHPSGVKLRPVRNGDLRDAGELAAEIPDFLGLSLREAMIKARALKIPVEFRGHGYVVRQSRRPGSPLAEGEKLILTLQG